MRTFCHYNCECMKCRHSDALEKVIADTRAKIDACFSGKKVKASFRRGGSDAA